MEFCEVILENLYFLIAVQLNFLNAVSHKPDYIKPIREAFDFVEQYFKEVFTDSNNKFNSTCIESLTAAKLLSELESSSVKSFVDEILYRCIFYVFL